MYSLGGLRCCQNHLHCFRSAQEQIYEAMDDRFLVLSRECFEAHSAEDFVADCRLLLSRFNTPHTSMIEIDLLGHNLLISQDPNSKHLGTTVWDSSLVFAKFLERNSKKGEFSRDKLRGKRVIELGAGCGLAGLGMALLGCNVVATDQVAVLPLLLRNVERNMSRAKYAASDNSYLGPVGNVEVAELDWGNEVHIAATEPPFDYIIGTDVVYVEHLLEPLMMTMLSLAGPKSTVMLGYEFRSSGVREKLHKLCEKHFHVKKVLHCKMDPKYQHPNIDLFILRRIATVASDFLQGSEISGCSEIPFKPVAAGPVDSEHCSSVEEKFSEGCKLVSLEEETSCQVQREGCLEAPCKPNEGHVIQEICIGSSQSISDHLLCGVSGSHLIDWDLRRLGSSAAGLLSEIVPPSRDCATS